VLLPSNLYVAKTALLKNVIAIDTIPGYSKKMEVMGRVIKFYICFKFTEFTVATSNKETFPSFPPTWFHLREFFHPKVSITFTRNQLVNWYRQILDWVEMGDKDPKCESKY
jgi:hypothetical protein